MTVVNNAREGLNIRQAAERLGVHYQTMRTWIEKGQVPVTRFGPKGQIVRIHPDDLASLEGRGSGD